jgi:AcrR family transcriptional regulator
MRMTSEITSDLKRRVPQRPRGELRVAAVLDAAAAVIEEVGYEAATMTAIAQRAGSSIGAIYQYYRDKPSLADALRNKFGEELSESLGGFADRAPSLSVRRMVLQLVQIVADFTSRHPALLVLLSVPTVHDEDAAFRHRLRLRLAKLFQSKTTELTDREAYRVAMVTLQVLKGLHPLTSEADPSEQQHLREEVRTLLTTYLESKLH